MSEWPDPYLPVDDNSDAKKNSPPNPHWPRKGVVQAGQALATAILSNPLLGEQYREFARQGKGAGKEHLRDFTGLISTVYPADYSQFNANDFANVHHVAWMFIGFALASLTNLNPHGDWAEPPSNGSVHAEEDARIAEAPLDVLQHYYPDYYHFVPNATGYYAVGTPDAGGAPNTGV